MEANFVIEANKFKAEADKKMSGGSFFKKLFGSKEDWLEEARDLYEKAANSYKLGDKFDEAGHCYEQCADIEKQLDGMPGNYVNDALACYKKSDPVKYSEMVDNAIYQMCQEGRISQAARMKKDQGEQMEEMYEIKQAAKCYKDAGSLFEKDDASSQAN